MVTMTPETCAAVEGHIAEIVTISTRLAAMWQILGARETHRLLSEINNHAHSAGLDIALSRGFYVFEPIVKKTSQERQSLSIDDL